jgi:hypothetical protein
MKMMNNFFWTIFLLISCSLTNLSAQNTDKISFLDFSSKFKDATLPYEARKNIRLAEKLLFEKYQSEKEALLYFEKFINRFEASGIYYDYNGYPIVYTYGKKVKLSNSFCFLSVNREFGTNDFEQWVYLYDDKGNPLTKYLAFKYCPWQDNRIKINSIITSDFKIKTRIRKYYDQDTDEHGRVKVIETLEEYQISLDKMKIVFIKARSKEYFDHFKEASFDNDEEGKIE